MGWPGAGPVAFLIPSGRKRLALIAEWIPNPGGTPEKGQDMKIRGLYISLIAGATVASSLQADVIELDLGSFHFGNGTSGYEYQGDHGDLMGSDVEGEAIAKTVATVDLAGLIHQNPGMSIAWIRIEDPGCNFYNTNPGADIDLFAVAGSPEGLSVQYDYEGINSIYADHSSDQLAIEVAQVDFEHGSNDASPMWISLGDGGSLTMNFTGWPDSGDDDGAGGGGNGGGDDGGDDDSDGGGTIDQGDGPELSDPVPGGILDDLGLITMGSQAGPFDFTGFQLRLNEIAPTAEWVHVMVGLQASSMTVVPGPAGLAVLPLATALFRLRRRR